MRVVGIAVVVAALLSPAAVAGAAGAGGFGAWAQTVGAAGPTAASVSFSSGSRSANAGSTPSGGDGPGRTGTRFAPPLPTLEVVTPFRPPPNRYGAGHRGVDLEASEGEPVRAAADGVVVYAGPLADRGVVSVEHAGGLRTTYEPVDAAVTVGQRVSRGEILGTLAAGHPSCAPARCLHLGARLPDRIYLDPMALFDRWRIRLKPWAGIGS